MRTLIIIKGQLRTWNINKLLLKSYIENVVNRTSLRHSEKKLFHGHKIDILVSYWDVSYQLYPSPFSISYLERENLDVKEVTSFFKGMDFVENIYFDRQSFLEADKFFKEKDFELEEEYHLQSYLTYKTGLYKRKIEADNAIIYDLILELRPDAYYEYETASKILKMPLFGEILSLHGNVVSDIHGMVSAMTEDLIFFMTGQTYNIFTKEIIFHYLNYSKKKFYSTAHVEKNLFYMENNFQVNDMSNGLCSLAFILRPTADSSHLNSLADNIERTAYVRKVDNDWRGVKELELDGLIKKGLDLEFMAAYIDSVKKENLRQILNILK